MAEEEHAPLQPALWQAEGPVPGAGPHGQYGPGPGLPPDTQDAKGPLCSLLTHPSGFKQNLISAEPGGYGHLATHYTVQ